MRSCRTQKKRCTPRPLDSRWFWLTATRAKITWVKQAAENTYSGSDPFQLQTPISHCSLISSCNSELYLESTLPGLSHSQKTYCWANDRLTSVCTIKGRCIRRSYTTPYTSTVFSISICWIRRSMAMNVPVLPTPALQWHREAIYCLPSTTHSPATDEKPWN